MHLDWTRADKVPPEHRYSDYGSFGKTFINGLVRLFFKLRAKPDVVWLGASFTLLVSGFFFLCYDVFLGFFFLISNLILSRVGDTLAAVGPAPTLSGRYLNGILSFVGVTFVVYCLAQIAFPFLSGLFFIPFYLSLILQHAYFEYFASRYLKSLEVHVPSLLENLPAHTSGPKWIPYLRKVYVFCYSWQSKAIYKIDLWMRGSEPPNGWYRDKKLLTKQTIFRRGFQLGSLAILTFFAGVFWATIIYLVASNCLWVALILKRKSKFKSKPPRSQPVPLESTTS